jgi:hypothetical protein
MLPIHLAANVVAGMGKPEEQYSMTTYAYRISLNDTEMIAVREALNHYRRFCESELADGPRAPYLAHLHAINSVLARLLADTVMTSTSSFCWPKSED